MRLNIWKNQTEIEKTYEVDTYDIFLGNVEDLFSIFDGVSNITNTEEVFKAIQTNRSLIYDQLKDIFPELTDEELRKVKILFCLLIIHNLQAIMIQVKLIQFMDTLIVQILLLKVMILCLMFLVKLLYVRQLILKVLVH